MLARRQDKRGERGFTLAELTVTIAIVTLAAMIAIPTFKGRVAHNNNKNAQVILERALSVAKEFYYDDTLQAGSNGGTKTSNSFTGFSGASPATVAADLLARESDLQWKSVDDSIYPNPKVLLVSDPVTANMIKLCNQSGSGTYFCLSTDAVNGNLVRAYSQSSTSMAAAVAATSSTDKNVGWK